MVRKKISYVIIFLLFILASVFGWIIFYSKEKSLKVNFLDVGQGDAILISQGKKQILIDGGPSGQKIMEKLGTYVPFWDREIEVVIATHPDSDHIEGLINVLQAYKVDIIIETEFAVDSAVYDEFQKVIAEKNVQKVRSSLGTEIKFDEEKKLEILSLNEEKTADQKETNSSSIVSKLTVGKEKFLFTGDLPSEKEMELISKNINLSADILKVAHHGSKYSTSAEFLDKVNPAESVISAGKNNRYGHPNPEALERLKNKKIRILRTDEMGDIVFECQNSLEKCQLIAN